MNVELIIVRYIDKFWYLKQSSITRCDDVVSLCKNSIV